MSGHKDVLLMMKDTPVLQMNLEVGKYEILNEKLIPFQLKNRLRIVPNCIGNYYAITNWLAGRVLPISRDNAKKIYNLFGFSQQQNDSSKSKIAFACRALSIQDNYWLKLENDEIRWDDVNLRNVSINEDIARVSLLGSCLSLQNRKYEAVRCPELSGQGAYAKAWLCEEDELYLHKAGNNGTTESKIEVMVSRLLDNCNVKHLKYEGSEVFGMYTCKCRCMTDDTISILPGMDFDGYCYRLDKDPKQEALRIDPEMIYKMMIVDYLIANPDRHGMNWGFFYNCDTMEILGCHPLYDHNNSFDIEYMRDPDMRYLYDDSHSMEDWAKHAMKKVDFHFYREFMREDFMTDRQYKEFTRRASKLGIKVIPNTENKSSVFC